MNVASGSKEVTMDEIGDITDFIQEQAGLTADIIWGNCVDENLGEKICVTIIATGFKTREELGSETTRAKESQKTIHKLDEAAPAPNPTPAMPELSFNEPTLKKDIVETPVAVDNREVTFEFNNVSRESVISTPVAERNEEQYEKAPVVYDLNNDNLEDETDEQLRKARERVTKLKQLSYRIGNPGNIADMEKEPAFKRRNVKLDSVAHSSESSVSRYTLSNEEEKKTELRQNNSFLHDNVD
jgi:cell division protein FtsZ